MTETDLLYTVVEWFGSEGTITGHTTLYAHVSTVDQPQNTYYWQRNTGDVNWESERDMAKDVEENHELYAALADESDDE